MKDTRIIMSRVRCEPSATCRLLKKKNSEALQLEKTVFGGNNEIAVWLYVINVRESNAIE